MRAVTLSVFVNLGFVIFSPQLSAVAAWGEMPLRTHLTRHRIDSTHKKIKNVKIFYILQIEHFMGLASSVWMNKRESIFMKKKVNILFNPFVTLFSYFGINS